MVDSMIGISKDDVDTPALCLDLDLLESNIQRVSETCRSHGVGWRPHSKGHKVPRIAHWQLAAGAIGITCAKLGEAEVMAEAGIRDLLIANQIAGPRKLERLVALRNHADPIVCVDHLDQVEPIADAMHRAGRCCRLLIEIDLGMGRAGLVPGAAVLELATAIDRLPGVRLAGIMGYEGHLLTQPDPQEKGRRIGEALKLLDDARSAFCALGLCCDIVSCGGTGSYTYAVQAPGITEVQAGGAIFMDAFYRRVCNVSGLDDALTVVATIVGRPARNRAIIDAGRKTMNIELHKPIVLGRDDVRVDRLSAEHGILELDPSAQDLAIGDRLEFIPGYADLTTVLHDEFLGFRAGRLEMILPIAGRGKLR